MIELPVIHVIPGPYNGAPPCRECGGQCCHYLAVRIDTPVTADDFDEILWIVLHRNVAVFEDDAGQWYAWFFTPCDKVTPEGQCGIYDRRPRMCEDYGVDPEGNVECEATGGEKYDVILTNPDEVRAYVENHIQESKEWINRCFPT